MRRLLKKAHLSEVAELSRLERLSASQFLLLSLLSFYCKSTNTDTRSRLKWSSASQERAMEDGRHSLYLIY
jgi:hypothetical protein